MRFVTMGVRTAVVCTLLALLPHLPAAAASRPPAFCDIDGRIIPGARIGKLMLNQPVKDARRLLDAAGFPPEMQDSWVKYTIGPNDGIGYIARGGFIQAIALSMSFTWPSFQHGCRTPNGLGLDSSEHDVLAVYGPAPRVYHPAGDLSPELHPRMLVYDNRGVAFGIVTLWSRSFVTTVNVFAPGTFCTTFPKACSP